MPAYISIDSKICIFAALLILILPLNWLAAAFFAAVFHELCHIGALLLMKGQVLHIKVGISGAVIDADVSHEWKKLFSTIAGPLGSISLLSMCHWFPRLSICGLVQGIFNLLPLMPLDGGRILLCILTLRNTPQKEAIMNKVEVVTYIVIIILAISSTFLLSAGFLPILAAAVLIIKAILRKRPCKQRQIKVQ